MKINSRVLGYFLLTTIAAHTQAAFGQSENHHHWLPYAPENNIVAYEESVLHQGSRYTRVGFINKETELMTDVVFDADNNLIDEIHHMASEVEVIDTKTLAAIESVIRDIEIGESLEIDIGLKIPSVPWNQSNGFSGSVELISLNEITEFINDESVEEQELVRVRELKRRAREDYAFRKGMVISSVQNRVIERLNISERQIRSSGAMSHIITVTLEPLQLAKLLNDTSDIASVRLPLVYETEIFNAMAESGVDPHALSNSNHSGTGIGIYQTEPDCPAINYTTDYTLLGTSAGTLHPQRVASIMRFVSPDAHIYCRNGTALPSAADLAGTGGNPAVQIVNISAGAPTGGAYSGGDQNWDNLSYANDVVVFKSVGNRGAGDGFGTSPGLGPNVLAIGAYNDQTDTVAGFSSFVDPNTRSLKPELSAPGVTIAIPGIASTNAAGADISSGTSFAAPHAAAMAANFLEHAPTLQGQVASVRASLIAGAKRPVAGGGEPRRGIGGADYYQFITGSYSYYINGNNAYFENRDAADGNDDGWVTRYYNLSSSLNDVRLVLTWQNDGDFVAANATMPQPLGANYDVRLFDPNGAYIGCGCSLTDQYEVINFNPAVTGAYKIQFRRLDNADTDGKSDVSWALNWQ